MNIAKALRFKKGMRMAAVGAGGKSSLLFALSRQIPGKVIITTTTHFAIEQLSLGDMHLADSDDNLIEKIKSAAEAAVIIVSGSNYQRERVNGPSAGCLEEIKQLCDKYDYSLLIEADGSRKLSLKAYGEHEPVLPAWIDLVVFVVGCSAIGRRLDEDTVFRASVFAELSQSTMGSVIQVEAICKMLNHPKGGLKHCNAHRRSVVLFNQADQLSLADRGDIELQKDALLENHDAVLIAALKPGELDDTTAIQVYERLVGVILAAGGSARLGYPKQLLPFREVSFLRAATLKALGSGLKTVYVVLGYQAERIAREVEDLPVILLQNELWSSGQSSSVKLALQEIQNLKPIGGILFLPVDQPFLSTETLNGLIKLHSLHCGSTIIPYFEDQPGAPVLFDADHFNQLGSIQGDKGGRSILKEISTVPFMIHNKLELLDIDTRDLYKQYINEFDFQS